MPPKACPRCQEPLPPPAPGKRPWCSRCRETIPAPASQSREIVLASLECPTGVRVRALQKTQAPRHPYRRARPAAWRISFCRRPRGLLFWIGLAVLGLGSLIALAVQLLLPPLSAGQLLIALAAAGPILLVLSLMCLTIYEHVAADFVLEASEGMLTLRGRRKGGLVRHPLSELRRAWIELRPVEGERARLAMMAEDFAGQQHAILEDLDNEEVAAFLCQEVNRALRA